MGVYDLLSKRQAREGGYVPALQTEVLPERFRGQVVALLLSNLGRRVAVDRYSSRAALGYPSNEVWHHIFDTARREYGRAALGEPRDPPDH